MDLSKVVIANELKEKLVKHCFDVIACIHEAHRDLGPGMPEYIYQEALTISLLEHGFKPVKEYQHHPIYHVRELESYLKMDLMVPMPAGNVIIECKAIKELTLKEQYQTFGYLRGTDFPIAILVNFGTWPKAQIQRYYYDKGSKLIYAF